MANYRKSFNLRNGVQIDDDNFIVNANGLVGIGTSIPREFLDVRGNAQIVGLVTANSLYAGIATTCNCHAYPFQDHVLEPNEYTWFSVGFDGKLNDVAMVPDLF